MLNRVILSFVALLALAFAVYFSFQQENFKLTSVWLVISVFAYCMAWSKTIESVSILGSQIKFVRNAINELKELAKLNITILLELTQTQMRVGGVPEDKKLEFLGRCEKLLANLDFQDKEISEIQHRWHYWVEGDYVRHILGGNNMNHPEIPKDRIDDWWKVKKEYSAKANQLTPNQLREIFNEYDGLTDVVEENIKDYEYYIEHKEHRDLDKWIKEYKHG